MNTQNHQLMILLRGGMGSGKTTVGRLLRDSLPRSISISFNILHSFLTRDPVKNKSLTFETALLLADFYLNRNFSVILDELFIFPETLEPFFNLGRRYQIPVFLFELEVSPEEAFRRYTLQGIKEANKESIQRIYELLSANPLPMVQKIDTHQYAPEEIKDLILQHISERLSKE